MIVIDESEMQIKESKMDGIKLGDNQAQIMRDRVNDKEVKNIDVNDKKYSHQSIQCDQQIIQSFIQQKSNTIKDTPTLQKVQSVTQLFINTKPTNHQNHQTSINDRSQNLSNNSFIKKQNIRHNHNQHQHQHSHINNDHSNNHISSQLKQMLKFHQVIKPKVKKTIFQQLTTQNNFNNQNSFNRYKNNISDLRNSSFIKNQNSKWLKSQSYMQQKQKKIQRSLHESLLKSYHKHESKYFHQLQKYIKAFIQFQDNLTNQPFRISLLNTLQQIKQQMELYLQNTVALQNLASQKPSYQWTQQKLTNFFTQYQPIFLKRQSINSMTQKLTLKKYKNCVYFGHMVSGKKQGQGIIYYFNGKVFEGNFKNDQKIFGFQIETDEYEIYIGEFDKGIRHGTGMLKNNEYLLWGRFTKGQFQTQIESHSQVNSKQQIITKKDFVTRSHFNKKVKSHNSQQKQNKQGFKLTFNSILVYSNNFLIVKNQSDDIFIGSYNQETQQKHGQGLQIFMNGDLYIGNYENNTPQQYGEYYWASGAFYRGQFLSGMRHGKGKWQMLHGDSYQGEYMNDKKNGQGIYHWKNGSKYTGAFQNDYRHGYGEMQWNDGRSYKGEWINGIEKNVTIQLDNGVIKSTRNKNSFNTISVTPGQKKTPMSKRYNLPSVQKKQIRSVSNPSTRNSFQTLDTSLQVRKKITLQNIKALYNPSNH